MFRTSLFDYLRQNGDAADAFHRGMADVSSLLAYAVLMAYDFAGISSIVDIGGGHGTLLEKILQFHPKVTGTVFDTSLTIERAKHLGSNVCARRCSYVAGDFFASVPQGADAYLLCGIIHDWDDSRATKILKNCREAMTENGRLLLVDTVVRDCASSSSFSNLLDLNMLVMTGGRERSKAELAALFDAADYKLTRIIPTMAPQSIIEGRPNHL
jgi:SAM-dependent methyltransferase